MVVKKKKADISLVSRVRTTEMQTKDHIRGPRTIENGRLFSNSKQNIYVWNLKLQDYREEHKSYLQGVFQLVT